jgi:hypothetical protein
MSIPVETKSLDIVSVQINIYQLILNFGFKCVVYQYDANGKLIQSDDVEISGSEYNSWMNDNDMIILILSKIGLTPK